MADEPVWQLIRKMERASALSEVPGIATAVANRLFYKFGGFTALYGTFTATLYFLAGFSLACLVGPFSLAMLIWIIVGFCGFVCGGMLLLSRIRKQIRIEMQVELLNQDTRRQNFSRELEVVFRNVQ